MKSIKHKSEIEKEYLKQSEFFNIANLNTTIKKLTEENSKYNKFLNSYQLEETKYNTLYSTKKPDSSIEFSSSIFGNSINNSSNGYTGDNNRNNIIKSNNITIKSNKNEDNNNLTTSNPFYKAEAFFKGNAENNSLGYSEENTLSLLQKHRSVISNTSINFNTSKKERNACNLNDEINDLYYNNCNIGNSNFLKHPDMLYNTISHSKNNSISKNQINNSSLPSVKNVNIIHHNNKATINKTTIYSSGCFSNANQSNSINKYSKNSKYSKYKSNNNINHKNSQNNYNSNIAQFDIEATLKISDTSGNNSIGNNNVNNSNSLSKNASNKSHIRAMKSKEQNKTDKKNSLNIIDNLNLENINQMYNSNYSLEIKNISKASSKEDTNNNNALKQNRIEHIYSNSKNEKNNKLKKSSNSKDSLNINNKQYNTNYDEYNNGIKQPQFNSTFSEKAFNFKKNLIDKKVQMLKIQEKKEIDYIFKKVFDKRWEHLMKPKYIKTKSNKDSQFSNPNYSKGYTNSGSYRRSSYVEIKEDKDNENKDKSKINNKGNTIKTNNTNTANKRNSIIKSTNYDSNKDSETITPHNYLFDIIYQIKSKIFFMKSVYDYVYPNIIIHRLKEEDKWFKQKNLELKLTSLKKEKKLRNKGVFDIEEMLETMKHYGADKNILTGFGKMRKVDGIKEDEDIFDYTSYMNGFRRIIGSCFYKNKEATEMRRIINSCNSKTYVTDFNNNYENSKSNKNLDINCLSNNFDENNNNKKTDFENNNSKNKMKLVHTISKDNKNNYNNKSSNKVVLIHNKISKNKINHYKNLSKTFNMKHKNNYSMNSNISQKSVNSSLDNIEKRESSQTFKINTIHQKNANPTSKSMSYKFPQKVLSDIEFSKNQKIKENNRLLSVTSNFEVANNNDYYPGKSAVEAIIPNIKIISSSNSPVKNTIKNKSIVYSNGNGNKEVKNDNIKKDTTNSKGSIFINSNKGQENIERKESSLSLSKDRSGVEVLKKNVESENKHNSNLVISNFSQHLNKAVKFYSTFTNFHKDNKENKITSSNIPEEFQQLSLYERDKLINHKDDLFNFDYNPLSNHSILNNIENYNTKHNNKNKFTLKSKMKLVKVKEIMYIKDKKNK